MLLDGSTCWGRGAEIALGGNCAHLPAAAVFCYLPLPDYVQTFPHFGCVPAPEISWGLPGCEEPQESLFTYFSGHWLIKGINNRY